jgi:hypothetical protein
MNRRLATSLFAVGAYSLTLLASSPVASADSTSGVGTAPSSALLSPATAALHDGDEVRARAILALQADQLVYTTSTFTLSPATAALADGDDVRARFLSALRD